MNVIELSIALTMVSWVLVEVVSNTSVLLEKVTAFGKLRVRFSRVAEF